MRSSTGFANLLHTFWTYPNARMHKLIAEQPYTRYTISTLSWYMEWNLMWLEEERISTTLERCQNLKTGKNARDVAYFFGRATVRNIIANAWDKRTTLFLWHCTSIDSSLLEIFDNKIQGLMSSTSLISSLAAIGFIGDCIIVCRLLFNHCYEH